MFKIKSISLIMPVLSVLFLNCADNTTGPIGNDLTGGFSLDTIERDELAGDDSGQHQHRYGQEAVGEVVWYSSSPGTVPYSHRFIYNYSDGTLELDQMSVLAGCCPSDLIVSIDVSRGLIRICEQPIWDGPVFWVLAHLEVRFQIDYLTAREYEVRFDFPESGNTLTFQIDLLNEPSGRYCFGL